MQEFDANGNPKGPRIWPFGVRKYEKSVWTPKDVDELRAKLPGYKIKGPGSRAICWGQGRLDGPRRRLIEMRRGVYTMEEAAAICDDMEECTHFWMTVGPEYPNVVDWEKGIPYRAEFCRGPMVSILDDTNGHSFVGIKKRHSGAPPPKMIPPIPHPEGPLEAYGRDAGYFKSFRQKQQELKEAKKLDSLQSEANELIAMEKKDQQEDVKAELKSLQQRLPYVPPTSWLESSKPPRWKFQRHADFIFHERRSVGNASKLIASMDGELTTDNTGFTAGKLVHDLEQLEFIVAETQGALQETVQEAGCMGFRKKSTRSLVEVLFSLTCEK
eukprot:symbB.v1.2.026363.t1/scaffold2627.1/size74478/2